MRIARRKGWRCEEGVPPSRRFGGLSPMRIGATVDLHTLRLVRQVLVLFSRSFRPLEGANQFGDVIWLRENSLGVLTAEEPRNATG